MLKNRLTVFAAANGRDAETESELRAMGVEYCPIRIARAGMSPLADVATLIDLIRLMRRVRPDVVLSYTIKPVIWGGMAARLAGVPAIHSLVTGLGYAFTNSAAPRQWLAGKLARGLYRLSLRYSKRVFFQNPDDGLAFQKMCLARADQAVILNGSGIDLNAFHPYVEAKGDVAAAPPIRFLLIARLLWDKGISEYVEASRLLRQEGIHAEFHLVGGLDANPASLRREDIQKWANEGLIRYHGHQADVRASIRQCDVYVLPSYREGTPRTVLEAMAMGRAIITTDVPGCRETVRGKDECEVQKSEAIDQQSWMRGQGGSSQWSEVGGQQPTANNLKRTPMKIGRNGILVPAKDVDSLVKAMEFFVRNRDQIAVMGRESRRYAEERYDVHKVNAEMMEAMGLL